MTNNDYFKIELDELSPDAQHLVRMGQQKLKKQDRDLRTPEKHFATASPLVRPLEAALIYKLESLLKEWRLEKSPKGQPVRRQGCFLDLQRLLDEFMNPEKVAPLEGEVDQPQLGLTLVAMAVYFAVMDELWVQGSPRKSIPVMKDRISRLLQLEWMRRKGFSSDTLAEVEAYEAAFAGYGKKKGQTLDRRGSNINRLLNVLMETPGQARVAKLGLPESMFDQASLAILSLLADPERWQEGKTLLGLVGTKSNYIELNPERLHDNQSIGISESLTKHLHAMKRHLRFREAMALPIVGAPHQWRHTDDADCLNSTGGYDEEALRVVNRLGHGHHHDYLSVASQESLDAVNHVQQVRFQLDDDMAEFILACVEVSDQPGEEMPELASKPRFTREELAEGSGLTASFEEVMRRQQGVELIPEREQRNTPAGLQKIKDELGFDWDENNNKLRLLYIQADEDLARYQRTICIVSRIKELQKQRYSDGFSWVFGMDHRGRLYEKSDYFSPQRSDPERYSLMFAEGQHLDAEAKKQVLIALGGAHSGTKISHDERLRIGESLLEQCRVYGSDLFGYRHELFSSEIDEPWMFAQLCAAIHRTWDWNEPWCVPLFIDATCSGIQWWSSLTNDETVQRLCNLGEATSADEPFDAYRAVQESVKKLLAEGDNKTKLYRYTVKGKQHDCTPEERKQVDEAIKMRKALKNSLMTRGYGATLPTRVEKLDEIVKKKFGQLTPRYIAVVAAKIINTAMTNVYSEVFTAELFVKHVARQAINLQLAATEFDAFNYKPREDNELTLDELRARKQKIQDYADALETDGVKAQKLAVELKAEERAKTKPKFQKRISEEVATEWRLDRLSKRCDYWFTARVAARNEHDARHAHKAGCNLTWTVEDGYKVGVVEPYRTQGQAVKAGVLPQLRLNMTVADTVDRHRLIRASAPSFIHSLDSCLLRMVVNKMKCDVVVIHDCIGVLPGQLNQLRQVVASEMAAMIGDDGRQLLLRYLHELIPSPGPLSENATDAEIALWMLKVETREELESRWINDFQKVMSRPLREILPNALYMWN